MINKSEISKLFVDFIQQYNAKEKEVIWESHRDTFRRFWNDRILSSSGEDLTDEEIDEIVRILDRYGKGNTKTSEAVARVMIPQGKWRSMFREFRKDRELSDVINNIFTESDIQKKVEYINELYKMNEGNRNNLTGPSGNAINAMLAAYDPFSNSSAVSLADRQKIIEYFGFPHDFTFDTASVGEKVVKSNKAILDGFKSIGIDGSARLFTRFCYSPGVKDSWRKNDTVKRENKDVIVTIPADEREVDIEVDTKTSVRESHRIQALLADIGFRMGMKIWIPRSDRQAVLKSWNKSEDDILNRLPLNYDDTTLKTIEQIDVLWLDRRSIVRAFEIEHTTAVYSGILRMADLLALQPNMKIKLHIVAPSGKREKVFQEIRRPVFSLLESGPLAESCTYLSYDSIEELASQKLLEHFSETVLDDFSEGVETD
jgi:hypothetical protein